MQKLYSAMLIPFIVILDPGHGGEDIGAAHSYWGKTLVEKNFSLELAKKTAETLEARGIKTVLTRTTDRTMSLDERAQIANRAAAQAENSVFISIHANSSRNSESSGVETFVLNTTSNETSRRLAEIENGHGRKVSHTGSMLDLILTDLSTSANYSESVRLACTVQRNLVRGFERIQMPVKDRGIKQALFYVLMKTKMPAILIEPGFVSNASELHRLASPYYQEQLASSLVNGILRYRAQTQSPALLAHNSSSDMAISGIRKKSYPEIPEENAYCR